MSKKKSTKQVDFVPDIKKSIEESEEKMKNKKEMDKIKELIAYCKKLDEDFNRESMIEEQIHDILGIIQFEQSYCENLYNQNEPDLQIVKDSYKRTREFIKNEAKLLKEAIYNDNSISGLKLEYENELKEKLKNKKLNKRNYIRI